MVVIHLLPRITTCSAIVNFLYDDIAHVLQSIAPFPSLRSRSLYSS